jgi:flagellar basal body-associated protein FliL
MNKQRAKFNWDFLWIVIPVFIFLGGLALAFWLMVHFGDRGKTNCVKQAQKLKATDYYYNTGDCYLALNGKIVKIKISQ